MLKNDAWAGHQLKLELMEETEQALPESTALELVEALRDLLLLAGTAIMECQEADDED